MINTNETPSKPSAAPPGVLTQVEFTLALVYTARLALDCYAYWSCDEVYRNDFYPNAPYSDDEDRAAAISCAVALQERLDDLVSARKPCAVLLTRAEIAVLHAALTEFPVREEAVSDGAITPEMVETLAGIVALAVEPAAGVEVQ
jgi:hypothetical protein